MKKYNRQPLPQNATKHEIKAAILTIERALSYKPDLEYRLTMDLDYYRLRLQSLESGK